jgi:hypothetical protein
MKGTFEVLPKVSGDPLDQIGDIIISVNWDGKEHRHQYVISDLLLESGGDYIGEIVGYAVQKAING